MIGRMLRGRAVRATPYGRLLDLAWLVLTRLREDVPAHERTRLAEILRRNARNPKALTAQDRADLRRILSHVDVKRIGRDAALRQSPFGRGGFRRH